MSLKTKQLVEVAQRFEIDLKTLVKDPEADTLKLIKSLGMALSKDLRLKNGELIDCGTFKVRRTKESSNNDGPVYEFTLKLSPPELPPSGNSGN